MKKPNQEYKYQDITEKIIGCAMRVHSYMGNGFQEVIYQRCLAIEFDKAGLSYKRELDMPIYYYETPVGTRRADFVVEDAVLVELKALAKLDDVIYAQILNYLEAYKFEVGLLLNFGENSLTFKRFISSKSV
ncbi:GxxExxY protein [bacterium]|nr:GxxExxY protein [bacterium]